MKMNIDYKCVICEAAQPKTTFKKPSVFDNTIFKYRCVDCASSVIVIIEKLPDTGPTEFLFTTKSANLSPKGITIMEAKRQAKIEAEAIKP